jgi:RimJ/RimL family protein N-acetyltransferase
MANTHQFQADAPTLESERLVLRAHRREDFPDFFAMWTDPEVFRFIGGRQFTREEVWMRLLRGVGHWRLMGFGFWIVEEKASGRLVGEVGLGDFMRVIEPSLEGAIEAGWVLAPWAQGRGYATEAMTAALAWMDAALKPARCACIIDPDNAASIRVATKCGFAPACETLYRDAPILMFERRSG